MNNDSHYAHFYNLSVARVHQMRAQQYIKIKLLNYIMLLLQGKMGTMLLIPLKKYVVK